MKKDGPLCINFLTKKPPYKGLGADSEEKHEPVSDIDTAAADSLKVLDPKRPIREADMDQSGCDVRLVPTTTKCAAAIHLSQLTRQQATETMQESSSRASSQSSG